MTANLSLLGWFMPFMVGMAWGAFRDSRWAYRGRHRGEHDWEIHVECAEESILREMKDSWETRTHAWEPIFAADDLAYMHIMRDRFWLMISDYVPPTPEPTWDVDPPNEIRGTTRGIPWTQLSD